MELNDLENNFKNYLSKWINGIEDEIYFWHSIISNDEKWNSFVDNRKVQSNLNINKNSIKILDVGSGPMTICSPSEDKYIISCDPLADYYELLMKLFNRTPIVQPVFCFSERLYERFESNFFDKVFMRNAIDHSFFPMNTIFNLLYTVKIGNKVILRHAENEALRENYQGFHQFNIDIIDNDPILWNQSTNINIKELIKDIAIVNSNKEFVIDRNFINIELIKIKDFNILDYIHNNYYFDKYIFLELSQFVSNHAISLYNKLYNESKFIEYKKFDKFNNFDTNKLRMEGKLESNNKLIDSMAWWIPIKKLRNNFRNKFTIRPDQTRPDHKL